MATDRERNRCRERLNDLCEASLDCDSVRHEAVGLLQGAVGFDRWCWPLADPDRLIPLSGLAVHDYGPALPRVLELEYSGADLAAMDVVARRPSSVETLSGETGGDLARSPRWDEVLGPVGIGDEAVVACRDESGCWGWLKAYRDRSESPFLEEDLALLRDVSRALGAALRRSLGRDGRVASAAKGPAGVVVLDAGLRPVAATSMARAWMDALPGAPVYSALKMLPAMVYPVATLVRSGRDANGSRVLEQAVDGRWVMIEASALEGREEGMIAVTFRAATSAETFDRLARVYALTPRERDVVAAVVAGLHTTAVAGRLSISHHTVQDHLKAVFAKVGIGSRRELTARFGSSEADAY